MNFSHDSSLHDTLEEPGVSRTERVLIHQLAPDLRAMATMHLLECRSLLPDTLVSLRDTFRSPARQMELYKRGRRRSKNRWIKVGPVVTNATPDDTAHCVTQDGLPAACAWHIVLQDPETKHWLQDGDTRWAAPVHALNVLGYGDLIRAGCFFKSIPGGDWAHFEAADWRSRR